MKPNPLFKSEEAAKIKIFISIIITLLVFQSRMLRGDSQSNGTFSVELKEWLILEIDSAGNQIIDRGQKTASLQAEITVGQPIIVRALISAGHLKTVVLKGRVHSDNLDEEGVKFLLWSGQGDLDGGGLITLNHEETFITWQGQGLKTGILFFENQGESKNHNYHAVFYLSAI
ncbi:MAG: hypothetical protein ACUVWQ_11585 [Candidatus Aminicenantales bacterium]